MPKNQDMEPTKPAFELDVTESSPTIRDRRARLESSPNMGEKFDVLGFIGRGGMGAVFKVRHRQLDHVRAVKVLPSGSAPAMVERLRREAAITTDLTHPNIVTVYDLEVLEDGSLAIVMEYLQGEDLNAFVKKNGRMSVEDVRRRFRPVADALDKMHAAGVIHRDIKPANLFVCEDGSIKILDFGISRLTESDAGLTRTGGLIGTPSYMAPELFEGEQATAATDVYSLGAVLFFCLTGRKLFSGRTQIELISRVLADDPPRADEVCKAVPEFVANALDRALAGEAEHRWPTALALMEAMGSEETKAFRIPKARRQLRKRWATALAVAAGLAASVTVGVVASDLLLTRSVEEREEAITEQSAEIVPVRGGTLTIGLPARLLSLDPQVAKTEVYANVVHLLYDPLVEVDWVGELMPGLAESWQIEDDASRFVFHLHRDVALHPDPCLPPGKGPHMLDGEDVRASLERAFTYIAEDEDSTWGFLPPVQGFDEFLAGTVEHPTGIQVPNPQTVEVTFTGSAPAFLHCLNRSEWSIMAAESIESYGPKDLGFHAVGTGPFRPISANERDVVLERHEGFWQRDTSGSELPYLDGLIVKTYLGEAGAMTALRQGDIDLLVRIPPEQMDNVMIIEGDSAKPHEKWKNYRSVGFLDEAHRYLTMLAMDRRSKHPYTDHVEIRQAIRMAIDRQTLKTLEYRPIDSPLTDGMLGHEPALLASRDVEGARLLLREAGYPDGAGLPPLSMCFREAMAADASLIEQQLEETGLTVNGEVFGFEAWLQFLQEGGCDMVIARYDELVINDDPTALLVGLASRARLEDRQPDITAVIDEIQKATEQPDREALFRQLAQAIVDDSVLIFLEYRDPTLPHFVNVVGPRVRGLADPDTGYMNPRRDRIRRMWTATVDRNESGSAGSTREPGERR